MDVLNGQPSLVHSIAGIGAIMLKSGLSGITSNVALGSLRVRVDKSIGSDAKMLAPVEFLLEILPDLVVVSRMLPTLLITSLSLLDDSLLLFFLLRM